MAGKELTDLGVKALAKGTARKLHRDHGEDRVRGLYLRVAPPSASWVFRYMIDGTPRTLGLGGYPDVSLKEARRRARLAREHKAMGREPIAEMGQAAQRARRAEDAAKALTFKDAAEAYILAFSPSWKNPKHASQWPNSLAAYVYPVFGDLPVSVIETEHVLKALKPIWQDKSETASRVRQRIEAVLDWATANKRRTGDNPARWQGNLKHLLPAPRANAQHHAALAYKDMGTFMTALRARSDISALALEFLILTAVRTTEVREALWCEIDLDAKVWTIPAERMKASREHRVPLSDRAAAILERMKVLASDDPAPDALVFRGRSLRKPMSENTMSKLLNDGMGYAVTVHGFRSTFRDWAGETTSYPREVIEMALAHTLKNKTEAAYARGNLLERRRELMTAWAKFCDPAASNIAQLRKAGAA